MKKLLLLSLFSLSPLFAQSDLDQLEDDIRPYLPMETTVNQSEEINKLTSSMCQLRSSKFDTYITIYDPYVEGKEVRQIQLSELDRFFCSGVVINDNTFLTASHCYQGTIEQYIQKGKMSIPGVTYIVEGNTIKWTFLKECYHRIKPTKECPARAVTVKITEKMNDVQLVCKTTDGVEKKYLAPAKMGWPNPRFSAKRSDFDLTIWRTAETIDKKIARAPYKLDFEDIKNSVKRFGPSCKTMGFGSMNLTPETAGDPNFKILNTPVDYLDKYTVFSIEGDYLRGGDSGGGLFCQGLDGKYYLVGINSRVYYTNTEVNVFALNSFNKGWIEQILSQPNLAHEAQDGTADFSPVLYHSQALTYEKKLIEQTMQDFSKCIKNIDYAHANGYAPATLKAYKEVKKKYKKLKVLYKNKKESIVFMRSQNKEFLETLDAELTVCQMLERRD